MAATYKLRVLTPQGVAYEGEAVHTRIPTDDGFVGILANHAPYVASSSGGPLEIRETGGVQKNFQVGPGFFEIKSNHAVFLAQQFSSVEVKPSSGYNSPS